MIYRVEEETSSNQHYTFQTKCNNCNFETSKIIQFEMTDETTEIVNSSESECSICLSKFKKNEIISKLICSHYYHKKCIDNWFNIGTNKMCPLCRNNNEIIIPCGNCNNGVLQTEFIGKVLPIDLRKGLLNRHKTDGVYGIWGHDIDDLVIEKLLYDPASKTINMFIGS